MEPQILTSDKKILEWYKAGKVEDFPVDAGIAVKYKDKQIAVFQFGDTQEWYATQNMCPHRLEMALARGIIGSEGEEPKVACPFHKKTFSLKTGGCLSGDDLTIQTYPVKIEDGYVFIGITEDE
nr:nitrite reductase small subunit NirD [uncultured Carboxylicivirga sp.]